MESVFSDLKNDLVYSLLINHIHKYFFHTNVTEFVFLLFKNNKICLPFLCSLRCN